MKEQGVTVTTGSVLLSVAWAVIDKIERDAMESGREPSYYVFYSPELNNFLEGFGYAPPSRFIVYLSPYDGQDDEELEISDSVKLVFRRLEGDGMSYKELMESAYKIPFIYDSSLLRKYSRNTDQTGVEYMLLYLSDSRLVYLEGERFHVSIPFVQSSVASLHTHPEQSCMLSHADVESALDSLVSGAIVAGAVTTKCAVVLRRRNLVTEEDFIELKKLASFLRRKKLDYRLVQTRIYELNKKMESVILDFLYY
ncbi:MAG: hypothetical protein F7B59_01935 [Desulfurococcales archaeon]|nr:hypothetical protein [Desulfurococcales archaeon]